ncbi:MAG: hypothetical protein CMF25_00385 [Kangiellaceae bacterium]|nr:hypothetical protein [Kangiellaceae bacterium]
MEQKRLDECVQALNSRGVKLPCPRCGQKSFSIVAETIIPINDKPNVVAVGGPSIPTIIVACDNCGYITQHAQGPLGLLKEGGNNG